MLPCGEKWNSVTQTRVSECLCSTRVTIGRALCFRCLDRLLFSLHHSDNDDPSVAISIHLWRNSTGLHLVRKRCTCHAYSGSTYRQHVTKHCTYQLHTGVTSGGSATILESTAWSLGIQPRSIFFIYRFKNLAPSALSSGNVRLYHHALIWRTEPVKKNGKIFLNMWQSIRYPESVEQFLFLFFFFRTRYSRPQHVVKKSTSLWYYLRIINKF